MASTAPLVSRLDGFDLPADVLGGLGGFLRQFLHFVGDHREALARFAGAGRFDGGVQRQQIGLLRDRGDDLDDLADFGAGLAQLGDRLVGRLGDCRPRRSRPARLRAFLAISLMLALISSVAVATVCMLLVTCSEAPKTTLAWLEVSSALALICWLDFIEFLGRRYQGPWRCAICCIAAHLRARVLTASSVLEVPGVVADNLDGEVAAGHLVELPATSLQRPDHRIQRGVDAFDDLAKVAAVLAGISAGGQLAFHRSLASMLASATSALTASMQVFRLFLMVLKSPL